MRWWRSATYLSDGQILLVGNVRAEGQGKDALRYYNSVVAINDKGEIVDAVDKLHLVPGGEYFPFADFFRQIGLDRFVTMPTPFSAGTVRHPITVADGLRAAIFICYEVIFPDEVESGVEGADFIVNVTNDAWFGDTPGPYQHFRNAQIRAAGTGLPVVRSGQQRHFGGDRFAWPGHRCVRPQRARQPGRHHRHSRAHAAAARRSPAQRLSRHGFAGPRRNRHEPVAEIEEDLTPPKLEIRDITVCLPGWSARTKGGLTTVA